MPGFQDLEVNLSGNGGHGYIRLDWFTPDALPTWGDGRLLILGDKGFIEIRKYTDLAKSEKGNHLFLANNDEVKHIDCSNVKLPYFSNLINDVLNRTETACPQEVTYLSMELAIKAQEQAEKNEKISSCNNWYQYRGQNILKIFKKYLRGLMFTHYVV